MSRQSLERSSTPPRNIGANVDTYELGSISPFIEQNVGSPEYTSVSPPRREDKETLLVSNYVLSIINWS